MFERKNILGDDELYKFEMALGIDVKSIKWKKELYKY